MRYLVIAVLCAITAFAYAQSSKAPEQLGRYQIVADAKGGIWKIDTANGLVWHCYWTSDPRCVHVKH